MSEAVTTRQQELAGKYRPYPEYKDSGVVWLGDVPEHWVLSRVKDVAVVFGGYPFDSQRFSPDVGVPLIRIRDINTELTAVYFDGDVPQEAIVENNDVLIGMDGEFNVARWKGGKAALNQRVACVRTDSDELTTLLFYTLPFSLKVVNDLTYYTTVKHLSLEDIKKTIFALPQGEELSNIVAFLDYETARIDRLIAQQQRLIELLKEKRQAVISHAVTKGLNPTATMKDSGVEWLGQVPEHWQCVPFGLLVSRADLGGNYLGGQEENGIPFLKMGNLGRGCIVLDKLECLEEGSSFDDAHRLSMGDFLFNTRNSLDLVGKVAVWHDELEFALYNSNLLRVRFKKDFVSSPDFMGFVFNSSGALGWLALLAKGTTSVAAIYYKDLRSMVVPIPPVDEQNAISSFISKCLSRLDTLEKKAIQSINLMNERRTALISAAVTGKIDLRGWTPPADEVAA